VALNSISDKIQKFVTSLEVELSSNSHKSKDEMNLLSIRTYIERLKLNIQTYGE
jgi:hypothetical protein